MSTQQQQKQKGKQSPSVFSIIKNLKPALQGNEINYQTLCKQYDIPKIAQIIRDEANLNHKHENGIYIEKQMLPPNSLIPFIP